MLPNNSFKCEIQNYIISQTICPPKPRDLNLLSSLFICFSLSLSLSHFLFFSLTHRHTHRVFQSVYLTVKICVHSYSEKRYFIMYNRNMMVKSTHRQNTGIYIYIYIYIFIFIYIYISSV